jgi:hypothetical protein
MWMYPGPSCPDRPVSEELGDTDIKTQIHRVLAHGADLNPRAGPAPLGEGVNSTRVSLFAFTIGSLCHMIFSRCSRLPVGSCIFSQCSTGVTLPEDEVGREANHAYNEWLQAWR